MHITQSILEAIREEFEAEMKIRFDPEYTTEVMAIYDRACALALGKRFLNDKPALRASEENDIGRLVINSLGDRVSESLKTRNNTIQDVLKFCRKADTLAPPRYRDEMDENQ